MEFMSTRHFRTYCCLDWHKNSRDKKKPWQSFPSLGTIQKECKMNRQTIQIAIKDLVEWGLIKKVLVRRKKGGGYRSIYTIVKEPSIKTPMKRIREKMHNKKRQERDKKGRFTGLHKPEKRTCANPRHKPENMADFRHDKDHKPEKLADAIKPEKLAAHKSVNMANNQSSLTSIEPVLKNTPPSHSSIKRKKITKELHKAIDEKIPCGEKEFDEFYKHIDDMVAKGGESAS